VEVRQRMRTGARVVKRCRSLAESRRPTAARFRGAAARVGATCVARLRIATQPELRGFDHQGTSASSFQVEP